MARQILLLLMLFIVSGCSANSNEIVIYSKDKGVKLGLEVHSSVNNSFKNYINELFYIKTDENFQEIIPNADFILQLKIKPSENSYFQLKRNDKTIQIVASDNQEIAMAIQYFFENYLPDTIVTEIRIPESLNFTFTPDFSYREPYFPDNENSEFRKKYATNHLDDHWGIWGHNLLKFIPKDNSIWATINNKINNEQLCFSSLFLKDQLIRVINELSVNLPNHNKFMIMPLDNSLVCECDKCALVGNTSKNASPAVFKLINELAEVFPDKEFYSTSYLTTLKSPKIKLKDNVGVMLTTMDFKKGITIELSKQEQEITEYINSWKEITPNIYLWDYALNFDNYFDFYPTLFIAQQNLKWYKDIGIKGVFVNGNESSFSLFQDVKAIVYAKLLRDTSLDIEVVIKQVFQEKYPELQHILYPYYIQITQQSLKSNKPLDIYGGIKQSVKKYLEPELYYHFYDDFLIGYNSLAPTEREKYDKVLLGLTYNLLELKRNFGYLDAGFYNVSENQVKIHQYVKAKFNLFKDLAVKTNITTINESGYLISDYIRQWEDLFQIDGSINKSKKFSVKSLTVLDEEYASIGFLLDGAFGFTDYYNNWMLFTETPSVNLQLNNEYQQKVSEIELSFLQNIKHKIYLPTKVEVHFNGQMISQNINPLEINGIKKVRIQLPKPINSEIFEIRILKDQKFIKNSIASDEIVIR